MTRFDYAIAGGGLQAGLLALALRARQPRARIVVVERGETLGGNHTWCFHRGDVSDAVFSWLEPLVEHRWPGYEVRFPSIVRDIAHEYLGISSAHFHGVVSRALSGHAESHLELGTGVQTVEPDALTLDTGVRLEATVVIDARGARRSGVGRGTGYQKFIGHEVETGAPHGVARPVLMDATVDQADGYRFFYVLPFSPTRLLIEDTYFSDTPDLGPEIETGIAVYAERSGWQIERLVRRESGVLPMPWAVPSIAGPRAPLLAGYRGGWFHPGTGYSLPVASRLADFVARRPPDELFGPGLDRLERDHRRQVRFTCFLNRLLFRWYPPARRRSIFERFYGLPSRTIRNFYALELDAADRARLLVGRPPPGLSLGHRLGRAAAPGPASPSPRG